VAVVTGGNGGIGLGIAQALAGAGAAIAVWARNEEKSRHAAASLRATGVEVTVCGCDVADPGEVDAAAAATVAELGRIDVCVANAGVAGYGGILDLELEQWRKVLRINLDGTFLSLQACARQMVSQGDGGAIVVVSSVSAVHGAARFPHYAASKAAVLGLMRSVSVDLASRSIRVNALLPGWTTTDMTRSGYESDSFRETTQARTPVGRWATPAEIGASALFLADRSQPYHTGQTLVVDGGYTIY